VCVIERLGRRVDGGQRRGGVKHGQRGDNGLGAVRDGHGLHVVNDRRRERGVRVSLNGAVREVAADALRVYHGAVQAGRADQRGRGHQRGRVVVTDHAGFGGGHGDGGQQQRYHDDLETCC